MFNSLHDTKNITGKNLYYLIVSGITTGLSWLCYYKVLQDGLASIIVPIDKLSIVVTIFFLYCVKKLTRKSLGGLFLLALGTLLLNIMFQPKCNFCV